MNSNFVTEILCSVSFLVYLTAAASCSFEQSHRVSHRRAAISQSEHGGGIRLRGGEDGKSETIVVPTDCKGVAEAVKLACGQLKRYVTMPSEMEREAGKILDPDINNYGEAVLPETYEWTPASGQKIRVKCGEYEWGGWSDRKQCFKDPQALIIRSHLDFRGEDGVCCDGEWLMALGSSGIFKDVMLLSTHHMPGVGGGLTLNIGDGDWRIENCQLKVFPGPLTGVLAASGNSRVSLLDCILLPVELTNIGTHGYGMFAWGQSVVKFVGCEVQDFQVGADVSFNASVVFESCDVSHNRFAIYLHDEAHVSMSNCTLTQNHKSAFCVGHHGKDRASLALRNVSLLGNKLWSDDDRPKTLVEENVVIDLENFSLPVVYRDTNFTIAHVDQTFDEESEAERAFLHEYMTNITMNITSLHPLQEPINWTLAYPFDDLGRRIRLNLTSKSSG
uniref:Right handed beta helix domain-containing protein n=2 Tax=Guillardia theta TaxID=55529 RepID=A0A7S4JAE3_GUITH|mmetsp:Transcript_14548/g.49673  ORF Transcript_14548/g.49673 Transcript_14548/m.49673 type:complete len:447 (+) Transcript_14548:131-1471(+)